MKSEKLKVNIALKETTLIEMADVNPSESQSLGRADGRCGCIGRRPQSSGGDISCCSGLSNSSFCLL